MHVILTLQIILIVTSVMLIALVLLQRSKGGGLTSLFGGGVQSSLSGSAAADRNIARYTIFVGLIWFIAVVGNGLLLAGNA
ncbi:Preprotein translocase subunit SecG [Pseudonocardia sp. Ae168_Ps1]|nr:Preprotein translocase subunit SecG [Pseudonocardia sp. Ae150A_Ps1]OLL78485.1 Preprotein translocase subunit SecG [Pseudonocardia sp. Ae168_Ps1]OLL87390.1 Preprotein translocase subunit SecG [Pseudonocardia sp. Ae263_Ps1]OLL92581.1 Preprotein translocase subunit SecG [Pseudonocardia sp. Ae356_Ps1]